MWVYFWAPNSIFFKYNFLLILFAFHIIYLNYIHFPVPSHLPSTLAALLRLNKKKIKFKRKETSRGTCNVTQLLSPYIVTYKC